MNRFNFKTDQEGHEFCEEILKKMVALFSIEESEALGRINRAWKRLDIRGSDNLIYHEDEEYWAKTIYYGHDSHWWLDPPDLQPLPYP